MRTTVPVLAIAALALGGCFSPNENLRQEALYDIERGDYPKAVAKINHLYDCNLAGEPTAPGGSAADSADTEDKNDLLWRMERGSLAVIASDHKAADLHLKDAARLVEERRTQSVTRAIGTYVGNDNADEYAGKAYEHVLVDYFGSLNCLLQAQVRLKLWQPPAQAILDDGRSADDLWNRAHSLARRMTIDSIRKNAAESEKVLTTYRYFDDPFARVLTAALVLATPADLRVGDDITNTAFTQLERAVKGYREQRKVLGADDRFRYEVPELPDLPVRLLGMVAQQAPERAADAAKVLLDAGLAANDARFAAAWPKDKGLVLVLNHAGWVTPTNELTIMTMVGIPWQGPEVTPQEAARGVTKTSFNAGLTGFFAKGPNSKAAEAWGAVIAGACEVGKIFGGINPGTIIGFGIPQHRLDKPIAGPAAIEQSGAELAMQVVEDVDAYARATLKDEQPKVLTKTLVRVAAKQVAAAAAGKAVSDQAGGVAGFLVGSLSAAAATLSESADTRYWSGLPDHIEAALVEVPAGQAVNLRLKTAAGVKDLGVVTVPVGRLAVISARSFPEPLPNPYTDKK